MGVQSIGLRPRFGRRCREALPEAIVVLSVRDSKEWWDSANSTIFSAMSHMPDPHWQEMIAAIFSSRSGFDIKDAASSIAAFEAHNESVKKTIPANRLVVWNAKDGWEPLCKALGVPVPNEPFPLTNTREEFQRRSARATVRSTCRRSWHGITSPYICYDDVMRTTLDIDQQSYRLAKAVAVQKGISLGKVVGEAILAQFGKVETPSTVIGRSKCGISNDHYRATYHV